MSKSCLIIGGGIGGLVTACLLAKEDYKITILEQHYIIGGGLHCFHKNGVMFETGIHYISGFQEGGVLNKIFKYLNIEEHLKIKNLDTNGFDIVHIGSDNSIIKMGIGKDNYIKILSEKFPEELENIQAYIDDLYKITDAFPLYNLKTDSKNLWYFDQKFLTPVGTYIEQYVNDIKLQSILAYNNCLYAGEKYNTPIFLHALITKFYIEGASRFIDGSQQLADAMVKFIESKGGRVYTSAKVVKVNVENKKVLNVVTEDNRSFESDCYISGIHPSNLLKMIDQKQVQRSYRERLKSIKNTYSVFTMFVSFKPKSFKYLNSVYYYFNDYSNVWGAVDYTDETFPPGFMLITPPEKNQGAFASKAIINCMMNFDKVKKWEHTVLGNRDQSYYDFKKMYQDKLIEKISEVFPEFKNSIKDVFSSTPLTIRDYLGSKEGSLYGYKKESSDIVKSQVLPRTKIENLLLTGQNINLHGIMGVPLGSIITAGVLLGVENIVNKINQANFVE
ncbi:MAG: FAD-dependent oxidoreductase [Bacteroidales bacterium]|nr:FAD-dependent oxidoreductase [Bacteroidales bacterium]MDD4234797.1 FAD-dependent oxidoreductase [Bacteroidales bacterium]